MNVLSLFDGMSCGQIALRELGIKIDNYFASEIDKYAIAQTQLNFPNTIQLGDVTKVKGSDLPPIDLLIGGSPCQGFSFAGKQLNFNDPRSMLFFEFVRILKEVRAINPNVKFLLENVRMKKVYEAVISEQLGIQPVVINSTLVSAQNRVRLYWTDIRTREEGLFTERVTDIPQPKNRGIFLRDILEDDVPERFYLSDSDITKMLTGNKNNTPYCAAMRGREACRVKKRHGANKAGDNRKNIQQLEPRTDGKTNALTTEQKDNLVIIPLSGSDKTTGINKVIQINPSKESGGQQPYQQNRIYATHGKSPALMAELCSGSTAILEEGRALRIRRLTPTECSRLQTVPAWYNWGGQVETQIYKMLGNGWTIEVIKHIFKFINQ